MTTEEPKPGTDELKFAANLTTDTGVMIPIEVTIQYPENQGMWAVRMLDKLPDQSHALLQELIQRGDTSVYDAIRNSPNFMEDDD